MPKNTEAKPDAEPAREEARKRLVDLTSEYYNMRLEYHKLSAGMVASSDSQGQMRSVLMAERLEEIVQETKRLLPLVYPQLRSTAS
jgi:hypothetical protein